MRQVSLVTGFPENMWALTSIVGALAVPSQRTVKVLPGFWEPFSLLRLKLDGFEATSSTDT